jgi:hypothetical protein
MARLNKFILLSATRRAIEQKGKGKTLFRFYNDLNIHIVNSNGAYANASYVTLYLHLPVSDNLVRHI